MGPLVLNIQSPAQLRRVLNRIRKETDVTWRNGQKPNGNNFYLASMVSALCLKFSQAGRTYLVWDHINTNEYLGSAMYHPIHDEDIFIRYLQAGDMPAAVGEKYILTGDIPEKWKRRVTK